MQIITLEYDEILHNTTVAFPTMLLLNKDIEKIDYSIRSRQMSDIYYGTIKTIKGYRYMLHPIRDAVFCCQNGGKEREMSTTKETIKVIAEGAEGHTVCHIIDEIAQNISDYYEETSEYYFDEDADFLIRSMVAKAYLDGEYEIAASIILIVFELLDLEYAADMLLLIARCVKKDGIKDFMDALFKKDGPFEVENIS